MKPQYSTPDATTLRMLNEFANNSARILAEKVGITLYPFNPLTVFPGKNYTAKSRMDTYLDKKHKIGATGLNLVVFRRGEGTGSPEPQTPKAKDGTGELFLPIGTFASGEGWIHGITSLTSYTPKQAGPAPAILPGRILVGGTLEENLTTRPKESFGFTYDAIAQEPFGLSHAICWNPLNFVHGHNPETTFQVGGFLEFSGVENLLFEEVKRRVSELQ
jgi:hypothetical protein